MNGNFYESIQEKEERGAIDIDIIYMYGTYRHDKT